MESAREQGTISEILRDSGITYRPQPEDGDITKIWAFGLKPGGFLSYYIGLDWLEEGKLALRVSPKVESLDYQRMFAECLRSPAAAPYLGSAYDIRIDTPFIACPDEAFDITPLIVLHYLTILRELLSKPLRKDYLSREENLKAKLKGKVMLSAHLAKNVFAQRPDRIMCRYQEFSTDCPENRLLHSAYRMGLGCLRSWYGKNALEPARAMIFDDLERSFDGIGYISGAAGRIRFKHNPLYREYGEALRLAKLIMRIQGYRDLAASSRERLVPPYIIDMSKLFELYVLALMRAELGRSIQFQSSGRYGAVDFIDTRRRIVIDAKYKTKYGEGYVIEDVRQVSGYARDVGILGKLGLKSEEERDRVVDCLIVYPNPEAPKFDKEYYEQGDKDIEQFHRIRKLGIRLPIKESV
ncbi:MAG: hypothetical protein GX438_06100 [Treponema sp.]|nr:hypothetical protein [Treponema sp.]